MFKRGDLLKSGACDGAKLGSCNTLSLQTATLVLLLSMLEARGVASRLSIRSVADLGSSDCCASGSIFDGVS